MNRGPVSGRLTGRDYVARALAAWGGDAPDFVIALAEEAERTSGRLAGERIGYSASVVSDLLGNKYRGDIRRVEEKIRGALLGAVVGCPVLGEIGRDRCLDEQRVPFSATSSIRSKLYRACRGGCPNARLHKDQSDDA